MSLLEEIPGLRAAIEQEQFSRGIAYAGIDLEFGGVRVHQFTLRLLVRLSLAESPFVMGQPAQEADVALFLWAISTGWTQDERARKRFLKRLRGLNIQAACEWIRDYLEASFLDAPASGKPSVAYWSYVTPIIHRLATEYGWTVAEIMDAPLAVVFQQLNYIAHAKSQNAVLFNPISDRVRGDWLKEKNHDAGRN